MKPRPLGIGGSWDWPSRVKAASTCAIVQPHVPTGRRAPLRYTPWSKKCGSTRSASQYYLCPTSWKIAHRVRLQLCAGGRIAIDYPLVQTVSEVHLSGRCPNSSRGVVCCERIHPSMQPSSSSMRCILVLFFCHHASQ